VDNSLPVDSRFANRSFPAILDFVARISPRLAGGEGIEQ
jgi:hypothetical protein